ncbi:MAG: ribose-phosphate diphosphokinase [Euryarchaeota archaeon]|nr:ribose-phosphate diphosphokinase [Euryarchaeota archaeon]
MQILAGSASSSLARRVAERLDTEALIPEVRHFPDGELYVRVPEFKDDTVAIIQTTYPSEKLIELFLLQDALREMNVKKIITIVPYFGYSRQDKIFNVGEAMSARAMARHIEMGADMFIGIDLHAESILSWFTVPTEHLYATRPMAEWLRERDVNVVISPDKGGITRARYVAQKLGAEFDHLEKTRLSGEEVVIKPKHLDIQGKRVAIVDDIISTGGTIARASEQLREQGADKIYAICTHGLFIKNAVEKLTRSTDEFAATDTIEGEHSKITVAGVIAKALRKIEA